MKNSFLFLFAALAISFSSCEKIKDATTVDIESQLTSNIPVSTIEPNAISVKSSQLDGDVFTFGGSSTFSLADDDKLVKYIDNIREIKAKEGTVLTFLNATSGNKILSLKLKYGFQSGDSEPTLIEGFSLSSAFLENAGVIEIYSDAWVSLLLNKLEINKDKVLHFQLSGTANYDIETSVKLKIPIVVSATPL